jgi:Cft2 family RNA processing exonuclease
VQFEDQTISRAARFPDFASEPCDVMILESTRGDRATPEGFTRKGEEDRLGLALGAALDRGAVLIPLFALGKTQELLSIFHGFRQRGQIPRECPIYIGGLGAKLTEIYDKLPYVVGGKNLVDLRIRSGRIFALSSGMMSHKTLSNVIARQFLHHTENSIFFVGYADPESPGGKLRAAKPGDLVSLGPDHEPEPVRCSIETFNFSAHASRETIRAYVNKARPKKLILVHGDPASVGWLAETLRADLPETQVIVPEPGVPLEL